MRDDNGHIIHPPETYMNKCKYFTGTMNKVCDAGVEYSKVRQGMKLPCFRNCSYAGGTCEKATFMTREEAEAKYAEAERWTASVLNGVCPECETKLVKDIIPSGRFKGHGSISCPKCQKVLARI